MLLRCFPPMTRTSRNPHEHWISGPLHRCFIGRGQAGAGKGRREKKSWPSHSPSALEAQIEALIRKARDRLRQQLDDVRRNAGSRHDQPQELKEAS
jgi:hypothetical protein